MPNLSVSDQLRQEIDSSPLPNSHIAEEAGIDKGQISRFMEVGEKRRELGGKAINKLCKYFKLELRPIKTKRQDNLTVRKKR